MRLSAIPISLLATAGAALENVQYGAFTLTATYSVANQLGFFTANGLNVTFNQVTSSTDAFNSILNGQYDILTATVDNALNYRFNQNQNVTVIGQLDQGPDLAITSVPSITDLSQLEGKSIIVDSPSSGYSFLIQYILSKAGLTLAKGNYSFTAVGATNIRYADLLNGTLPNGTAVYATLLTYPFTVESQALPVGQTPNVLARVSDYIAPITSSAFTVRQSSLSDKAKSALLTRFLASMYAANQYLLNPANAECSVKAIATQLSVSLNVARQEYTSVTDPVSGEISPGGDFTFNEEGLLNDVMYGMLR
ncbi:putative pe_pgrs family protein [Diaporthe ampelina]|uniref:Putative pe_pgrs family protein n=1 Tax=Diaporthe ampelina TaxID=1214573 RepID=A0A0G2HQ34_9PEZI|nr:putative pe_pgrs family protein [Diaporthe ampelina]